MRKENVFIEFNEQKYLWNWTVKQTYEIGQSTRHPLPCPNVQKQAILHYMSEL